MRAPWRHAGAGAGYVKPKILTDSCPRPRPGCTCSFLPRTSAGRRPGSLPVMRKSMPASWPTLLDRQVAQHSRLANGSTRQSCTSLPPIVSATPPTWSMASVELRNVPRSATGGLPRASNHFFRSARSRREPCRQHSKGCTRLRGRLSFSSRRCVGAYATATQLHDVHAGTRRRWASARATRGRIDVHGRTPAAALRRPRDGSMGRESAASAAR